MLSIGSIKIKTILFTLMLLGLAGICHAQGLVENWSINTMPFWPGEKGFNIIESETGYPEIIIGIDEGYWGVIQNTFGPNGYQLVFKSTNYRTPDSSTYENQLIKVVYDEMKPFGRDHIVMLFEDKVMVIDRTTDTVLNQVDFDRAVDYAWIHDFDNDGDPDIISTDGYYDKIKVRDLDTGEQYFELDYRASKMQFGQVDDDPGEEMIFSGKYESGGYVFDLETREIQWVYYPDFGNEILCDDIDDDGRDELVWINRTDVLDYSIYVADVDLQTIKYQTPRTSNQIQSIMLDDLDDDGYVELMVGPERGNIQCYRAMTGDLLWQRPDTTENVWIYACEDFDRDGINEIWWSSSENDFSISFSLIDVQTQTTEWSFNNIVHGFKTLAVADLDNNGTKEIIATTGSNNGRAGYPTANIFDSVTRECIHSHSFDKWDHRVFSYIYLEDFIPGRKGLEIMAVTGNREPVKVLDPYSYQVLWESEMGVAYAIPADLDDDGLMDVVASIEPEYNESNQIVVYNGSDGEIKSEMDLPEITSARGTYGLCVLDIDSDGIQEIGVAAYGYLAIVDGHTGNIEMIEEENYTFYKNLFFVDLFPAIPGTEIIYTHGNDDVFIRNGVNFDLIHTIELGYGDLTALKAIDIDSDGQQALFICHDQTLYLMNGNGNILWQSEETYSAASHIVCTDLDNDGVQDILFNNGAGIQAMRYGSASSPHTPDCPNTGVYLDLPRNTFTTMDPFYLRADVCNNSNELLMNHHVMVLLETYGQYFCLPSWTDINVGLDSYQYSISPGAWEFLPVQLFTWPEVAGLASGIRFWGAILNPEMSALVGEISTVEFGWQ